MGEFLRKLPLDVQFHNAFEEKLRRKLSMHNCFGFDRLDLEDGPNEFNLGELALAREIAGNLTSSELVQPTSFGDFTKLRSYWLEGIANYERDLIFNPQGYNEDKSKLNSYFLWTWILDTLGIVLEKEEDVFLKGWSYHKVEQHAKWVDGKIRSLSTSSLSKVKPANKLIPDIDEAAGYIQNLKDKGFRVGIAMGAFDLFHEGHLEFLKEAKELLGKYGKLGVVIPSDNLVGYAKGPERPVKILEKRTGSVSELASVDFTVPATYPQELSLTRELVEAYYLSLHQKLSPHFRLIGEQKDPNFDLYANQCLEAGIILLYKGEENVYSTTRQIEDILEKFSKT